MGRVSKWSTMATVGWPPVSNDPRAACRGADIGLFFSAKGRSAAELEAKRICRRCPLLDECRAWALPVADLHGVWGATTALERKKWRQNGGAEPVRRAWKKQKEAD